MLAEVVGDPGGSPFTCSLIRTGMQVLKGAGAELTLVTLAITPVTPGATAVTRPLLSTVATGASTVDQVKEPIWLVISAAFGAHGPDDA